MSKDVGSADGSGPHKGGVRKQAKSPQAIIVKIHVWEYMMQN